MLVNPNVELGKTCNKCRKDIAGLNELHFYCHWCKVHFCQKCGNEEKRVKTDIPTCICLSAEAMPLHKHWCGNKVPFKMKFPHHHSLVVIKVKIIPE
jgi:hypothetical protein